MQEVESKAKCNSAGFRALQITQFLGALNDNIFKLSVSLTALALFVTETGGTIYISLGGVVFVLPFILFSPHAGYLADRYSKSKIILIVKAAEIPIMVLGLLCFAALNVPGLFAVLFLMGLQSTLFGPAKYGIIPEIISNSELSKGNGYIQFWTFLALILGTASAGLLMAACKGRLVYIGVATVVIACVGVASSFFITKTVSKGSFKKFEINPFSSVISTLFEMNKNMNLFFVLLAIAFFWFFGSFFQMNVLLYAKQVLALKDVGVSMLLVSLALGVGSGSVLAGYASEKKVEIGLVPIAALGLIFFSALLGCVQHSVPLIALLIFLDGICGGAFVVPLFAYIQRWSPSQSRGRYLAATNFMSFNGVLLASALIWLFRDILSVSAFSLFFLMSLMVFVVMIFMYIKLPDAYIRCFNWIFVHVFYWRKVIESARIPEEGGALLVSNYTSYLDPVIIMASIERPIRFLISREFCDSGKLNRYARAVNAISTSLSDTPEQLNQTLESVEKAIKNGELVCVFAKTNETVLIKLCIERLTQVPNVPIVPLYIDKARGSLFNRQDGKYSMKFPARIPYPVTIYFGEVLASGSDEAQVKAVMLQLSGEALKYRR